MSRNTYSESTMSANMHNILDAFMKSKVKKMKT